MYPLEMVADNFHEVLNDLILAVPVQLAVEIELGVAVTSHDFDVLNSGVHRVSAASKQFALEPESVIDREGFADVFREFALQFLVNAQGWLRLLIHLGELGGYGRRGHLLLGLGDFFILGHDKLHSDVLQVAVILGHDFGVGLGNGLVVDFLSKGWGSDGRFRMNRSGWSDCCLLLNGCWWRDWTCWRCGLGYWLLLSRLLLRNLLVK